MKKYISLYGSLLFTLLLVVGVSYAAFGDQASILGSTFYVGSADIKLFDDVSLGTENENLVDEKQGPTFSGVTDLWSAEYLVKIYNNSSSIVSKSGDKNGLIIITDVTAIPIRIVAPTTSETAELHLNDLFFLILSKPRIEICNF